MLQIHEIIKQQRLSANLTEAEMAEKLGIKRSTYQYWETKTPATDKIKKVAKVLNLPDDYFFVTGNRGTSEDQIVANEPSPDSYLKKRQIIKNGEKKNQVPFYDAEAAAGLTETDMTPIHAPAGTIDVGDLLHDSKAAISIYGNSMLPSYPPGGE